MKIVNAILTTVLLGTVAEAKTYYGTDNQGGTCALEVEMKIGKTQQKDACAFEIDGEGPWCEGKPAVKFNAVTGYGQIVSPEGLITSFTIDDQYSQMSKGSRFVFGATADSAIYFKITGHGIEAKYETLTAFGKSLNQNIADYLSKHAGANYDKVYREIYHAEVCHIENK